MYDTFLLFLSNLIVEYLKNNDDNNYVTNLIFVDVFSS